MDTNSTKAAADEGEDLILCVNSQGLDLRGTPRRLAPQAVAFELYHPELILQLSEVLVPFRILIKGNLIYSGKAVVTNAVRTGGALVCEASLDESLLSEASFLSVNGANAAQRCQEFLLQWERHYKVSPEYKVLIADLATLLTDLRLWVQQVELGIRASPSADRLGLEREVAAGLGDPVVSAIDAAWHRFEDMAETLGEELHPAYSAYLRRQLHPLLLCSPFAYRAFQKPLGYAGDYEMVNMMVRDPLEGSSLFAKLVNLWLWRQPPAEAHRNRLDFLEKTLHQETARVSADGRTARIFNMACGPAIEVQRFLAYGGVAERAHLTLLDFNQETLEYTRSALSKIQGTTPIEFVKKSVHQMLRESGVRIESSASHGYDLIYCAGLFDYLSDNICQRLIETFYSRLAPKGLLLVTNVEASKHFRYSLEFILDWHLIYRNRQQINHAMLTSLSGAESAISTDSTGVNLFVEIRRPGHA